MKEQFLNKLIFQDRILASLLLAGMGDALGAPTEQWTIEEIFKKYGGLVLDFDIPPEDTFAGANAGKRGEVTDDASQMYYLARAMIAADGALDQADWVACLLDWASNSPKASFMGPSTAGIVKALQEGSDTALVGVIGTSRRKMTSVGTTNGAAMRVAPAGLIYPGNIDAACRQALITCLPSHDTNVAISAACSVAAAVSQALVSNNLHDVINGAIEGAHIGEQLASEHARIVAGPQYIARLEMALSIAAEATNDYSFLTRMERMVGNSVLAAESVPAALGVVAYSKGDALRTIALSASIGNDTDSIATMAGSIVGALVGTEKLPQNLIQEFKQANKADFDLDKLALALAAIAGRNHG
ncbi:ADP-ribosylglycohydrolase family protein [Undibacterium sp. CY18W]|uniref:ADP-ribosylglycohydrolase family protein n=1 Tax=Undibacterium hunanense TaxID=2762292 RepID=A0ABR6ZTS5_9BURK|nr:ADP-ribosylglycohydrolase family protein [Undibacterium hunanense]